MRIPEISPPAIAQRSPRTLTVSTGSLPGSSFIDLRRGPYRSAMEKAPSRCEASSPTGATIEWMIAVQGVMKNMPISAGSRPRSAATRRRRSFAASSRGVSIGTRWGIRSG